MAVFAGTVSAVRFWHEASGRRHTVFSDDASTVDLGRVAKELRFESDSLKLKHEASGDFIGVPTSDVVSLDVLRQHFAGEGYTAQPFLIDGEACCSAGPRTLSGVGGVLLHMGCSVAS